MFPPRCLLHSVHRFCSQVKSLFDKLEVEYLAIELDNFHEEAEIMDALVSVSVRRCRLTPPSA